MHEQEGTIQLFAICYLLMHRWVS